MAKIICFINQKGGVGKTTTTIQTAAVLSAKGKRVLMIDIDPQGNLTFNLGVDTDNQNTIYELLTGKATFPETVKKTACGDLIPSDLVLGVHEMEIGNYPGRENLLTNAVRDYVKKYDYILIDCPPALNVFIYNALLFANNVVIVMQAEVFAMMGLSQLVNVVKGVEKTFRKKINITGVVLTMYNDRLNLSKALSEQMNNVLSEQKIPIINTKIKKSVVVAEAQACQKSLLDYAPNHAVTKQYTAAVEELLALMEGDKKNGTK